MKTSLRIQSFALAAMLLVPILASCGGSADNPGTSASDITTADTTATVGIAELEVKDLGGKEINMLIRSEWSYEFMVEEEIGEVINDAIYQRNSAIEDRYKCSFNFIDMPGTWGQHENFANTIHNSVLAGDGAYDFVIGYQACLPININNGDMLNLLELPYLTLDAPWWTQEGLDALTINDRCYMVGGDIAVSLLEGIYCMYYNKTLAEDNKVEDLYQLVRDGKWTHEKMMSVIKDTAKDVNGDSSMTEEDKYGFIITDNYILPYVVAYDTPTLGYADDGSLEVVWNSEHTIDVLEKLVDMAYNENVYFPLADSAVQEKMFRDGQSLLVPSTLGKAAKLRDMNDDFGILPYPKYDELQKDYYTTTANGVSMAAIPITAPDPDTSALLIEALCRESHETVAPAFYDIALKGKYTRDENSVEMIELIRSGLSFDAGWINSLITGVSGAQYYLMVKDNDKNFASWYASNEESIQGKVDTFSSVYYD
ncbi:MAG: hypothetical protein IJ493_02255 [Clostridia bacterium]|nr:hypothetical protein [Clostridia bacterium]